MALDGVYLSLIKRELDGVLIGSRVDKIHQPSRESLIISLRTQQSGTKRLLISASSDSARVHLSARELENPKTPPMFCMLLRKHLSSARLIEIRQDGCERILHFDFETTDELGDRVIVTLAAEIMGKRSNIIMIKDGRVIDSIKRVGEDMSSVRQVLPGIGYTLPPREDRLSLFLLDKKALADGLLASKDKDTAKALVRLIEGISPIFAREAVYYALRGGEKPPSELADGELARLIFFLERISGEVSRGKSRFTTVREKSGLLKDFCFCRIHQYGSMMITREFDSPSELLDGFYHDRDVMAQNRQRAGDLFKLLVALSERISRRIASQRLELEGSRDRESLRLKGDLIMSNLYRLKKGESRTELENYLDPEGGVIAVELDPRLTPAQNAQRYYREYKKLDTAEKKLRVLIEEGERELSYIDSVFDSLSRASCEAELLEIREELAQGGYIRSRRDSKRNSRPLPPLEYRSRDGFRILAGRNNRQNDTLTLKTADGRDVWLHVKDMTGSHVIIETMGKECSRSALEDAAMIAAYNSSAKSSSGVPVDYTLVKYVKKPGGAKPGMVIFTNNKTLYVTPDEELVESMRQTGRS